MFRPRPTFDWRLRSRTLALGPRTLLMAIINLTPDSFSGDGLSARGLDHAVTEALSRLDFGADILDLGAESTRPDAQPLSSDQEQSRLLPVLEAVLRERPHAILSVDTYHAPTARAALTAGAQIVNDVSGLLWDEAMAPSLAASPCGLVLMHTRGRPTEWRTQRPLPPTHVLPSILSGLRERLDYATAAGIPPTHLVLDPGFGFGKRGAENFELLADLARLRELEYPILIGLSRKGFLAEAAAPVQPNRGGAAHHRLHATMAANTAAILAGAHIVRVHDLQAARESAAVADAILAAAPLKPVKPS